MYLFLINICIIVIFKIYNDNIFEIIIIKKYNESSIANIIIFYLDYM